MAKVFFSQSRIGQFPKDFFFKDIDHAAFFCLRTKTNQFPPLTVRVAYAVVNNSPIYAVLSETLAYPISYDESSSALLCQSSPRLTLDRNIISTSLPCCCCCTAAVLLLYSCFLLCYCCRYMDAWLLASVEDMKGVESAVAYNA